MILNENIEITREDNMALMARYPDNHFDLAVVDPPYGLGAEHGTNRASRKMFANKKIGWDSAIPSKVYFTELQRISKNQIIWGGNYFFDYLGNTRSFIIWDKKNPERNFADCELAWCSMDRVARIFNNKRVQEMNKADGGKIHPTQKPVKLYEWIFLNYAKPNQKILDTHIGSMSIAIALHNVNKKDQMNLSLTACELDEDYFNDGIKRVKTHLQQLTIF